MSSIKLVAVAIDFGTTYSGYAFSFRHDVTKIKTFRWPGGEVKTPTCILFNQNKQFHSFGTQAEDRYSEMVQNGENADWYFFKHFKLLLKNEVPSSSTMLAAMNGKKMTAIDVFSASIQYLKDHLLKQFQGQFEEMDVQWVLTVPAIWEDKSRQFMRHAATKAGIQDCDLTLTLEPEAASVYCKKEHFNFPAHMTYLLLDCGGGTVDIAVHESCPDGRLKAVYRPTGGLWGGIKVDDAFQSFLVRCCGVEAIQQLTDYEKIRMQRSFEKAKKRVTVDGVEMLAVSLPMPLRESFDGTRAPQVAGGAQIRRDKLMISSELLRTFFKKPIKKIVDHVKDILADPKVQPVHAVLMVGGFSESTLLQSAVKEALPNIAVRLVRNSSSAVLRGAVIYGHTPNIIRSRRSAFTYGFSIAADFINGYHDRSKLVYYDGIANCTNVYDKLITVDDMIEVGKTSVSRSYNPASSDQQAITLQLYRSTHPSPMYVTDSGCEKIGSLKVHMPDTRGGLDRSVRVTVMFGDSELKVEATDVNTQVKYTAEFDFLSSD